MGKSKLRSCRGMSNFDGRKLVVCSWVPGCLDLQINEAALTAASAAGVSVPSFGQALGRDGYSCLFWLLACLPSTMKVLSVLVVQSVFV